MCYIDMSNYPLGLEGVTLMAVFSSFICSFIHKTLIEYLLSEKILPEC